MDLNCVWMTGQVSSASCCVAVFYRVQPLHGWRDIHNRLSAIHVDAACMHMCDMGLHSCGDGHAEYVDLFFLIATSAGLWGSPMAGRVCGERCKHALSSWGSTSCPGPTDRLIWNRLEWCPFAVLASCGKHQYNASECGAAAAVLGYARCRRWSSRTVVISGVWCTCSGVRLPTAAECGSCVADEMKGRTVCCHCSCRHVCSCTCGHVRITSL